MRSAGFSVSPWQAASSVSLCACAIATAAASLAEPADLFARALSGTVVESHRVLADADPNRGPIDVRLSLQPDHMSQSARLLDAAEHALRDYSQWFGPYPHDRLVVVDVPWRSGLAGRASPGLITIESRWLLRSDSLMLEADIARGISRQWWSGVVTVDDAALADELVEYSQGLTVERLFADRNSRPGYSFLEASYFGGLLPWTYRGALLDRVAATRGRSGARLLTLERYLGWPALQRGLAAVIEQGRTHPISRDRFFQIVGDTVGQDLGWFSASAFERRDAVDYAIEYVTSVAGDCGGRRCFRTRVTARRHGVPFTGSSREPMGEYDSGRAIRLMVAFADGTTIVETWDGRSETKKLMYESSAPAVLAQVDPDRVLVLDARQTNNSRRVHGTAAVAANRWSAHWMSWLEDLLLSYATLV